VGDGRVQVGDLAAGVRVHRLVAVRLTLAPRARPREGRAVDLLGALVLAEVVADDGEVEPRLDVARVDGQRLLQRPLRGGELAEVVVDDPEHVVHVGEGHAARNGLLEMPGRQRIIAALEVLSAEGDQLPQLVVHALPGVRPRGSVAWVSRRTEKVAASGAASPDWAAARVPERSGWWAPRASRPRAARSARPDPALRGELPGSAPPSAARRERSASPAASSASACLPAAWAAAHPDPQPGRWPESG